MLFHYQKKFSIIFVVFVLFSEIKTTILVPISHGELIDKITILEIKKEAIRNKEKLQNVRKELALLEATAKNIQDIQSKEITTLRKKLKAINHVLWIVEDFIREHEKNGNFDKRFMILARLVYMVNDLRAVTKRDICLLSHSALIEEKEYTMY